MLGKPLIVYTIEQAQKSSLFDAIAVSSDSDEILNISKDSGVEFLIKRSSDLANDNAAKVPVIRNCVNEVEKITGQRYDLCFDLDCTSPLRDVDDIKKCLELMEKKKGDNLITAMPSRRSPYFNLVELVRDKVRLSKSPEVNVVRRQDAPKTYDLNASIYVWKREVLESENKIFLDKTLLYIMPENRSIDIDSDIDFKLVELLMREKNAIER